ncbi:hypothetical protein ABMY26_04290 [Azospirillum sp. HJ39]|uniref:hypothetical protein n=1 Tax=Azospirillum sp. HJ39 TaxID=3159496 RepID=UPI003555EB82
MNPYDVAIGLNQDTLNSVLNQAFGLSSLSSLFSNTNSVPIEGQQATVEWTVNQAPQISLTQPTSSQWSNAIDSSGGPPAVVPNAGTLTLPSLTLNYTYGGSSGTPTVNPTLIWTWSVADGVLTLTPYGLELTGTGASDALITYLLLPTIMGSAKNYMQVITLPTAQLGSAIGIELGPANFTVSSSQLLMVAAIQGQPIPDIPDASSLPSDNLFVQLSTAAMNAAAQSAAKSQVDGSHPVSGSGFTAEYTGTLDASKSSITLGSNPLDFNLSSTLSISVSATFLDGICSASSAATSL